MSSIILLAAIVAADPAGDQGSPGILAETETITRDEFTLTVPKGWRSDGILESPTVKLHLGGDGQGISIFDENRSPLQVGMSVEKFLLRETLEDGVADLVAGAKTAPRLRLLTEPTVEDIELPGKVPAKIVITQFLKRPARRSLQLKVCLKDSEANSWVVSGWIVAGEDSALPTPDSDLAKRLREFLETFSVRASD